MCCVICQSLHLQKQLTSLATSNGAEAKLVSEPCPGRPTMPPRGWLGQCLQRAWDHQSLLRICPSFFQIQTRIAQQLGTALTSAMSSYNCQSGSHVWADCEFWAAHVSHFLLWLPSGSKENKICVRGCKQDQTFWLVNQLTHSLSEYQCFSNVCCKVKISFLDDSFSTLKNIRGWENRAEAILFFSSCHYCSSSKLQHETEMKHLQDVSSKWTEQHCFVTSFVIIFIQMHIIFKPFQHCYAHPQNLTCQTQRQKWGFYCINYSNGWCVICKKLLCC